MTLLTHPNFIKYNQIIDKAISEDRVKSKPGQYESHHIIPKAKSIGGSNDKSNLVLLTPEEHYICHSLLPDFLEGKQKASMVYAWHRCNNIGRAASGVDGLKIIGAKKYKELKNLHSDTMKNKDPWNKGKTGIYSKETLSAISFAAKNQVHSVERNKKISDTMRGKKKSSKTVDKMSTYQNTRLGCVFCKMQTTIGNMKKHHNHHCIATHGPRKPRKW